MFSNRKNNLYYFIIVFEIDSSIRKLNHHFYSSIVCMINIGDTRIHIFLLVDLIDDLNTYVLYIFKWRCWNSNLHLGRSFIGNKNKINAI
jgi:hypothetical protein